MSVEKHPAGYNFSQSEETEAHAPAAQKSPAATPHHEPSPLLAHELIGAKHHWQRVMILRRDGTTVEYKRVKHILQRDGYIELFLGEHGKDRETIWWRVELIDHVRVFEVD